LPAEAGVPVSRWVLREVGWEAAASGACTNYLEIDTLKPLGAKQQKLKPAEALLWEP